jgi:hypothetical protein
MDSIQTSKQDTKTMHKSCHNIIQYAKQKIDQKMLIQMYIHEHLKEYTGYVNLQSGFNKQLLNQENI